MVAMRRDKVQLREERFPQRGQWMRSRMGLGEKKDHDLTPTALRETEKTERKARY